MKEYRPGSAGYEIFPPEKGERVAGDALPMQRKGGEIPDADFSAWDPSWGARRRGHAVARTLVERTAGLEVLRKYTDAASAFEVSYQQLLAAQARRSAIPLVVEREALALLQQIEQGRGALQAAVDLNADLRARRFERRELEAESHELELARRRRLILEEQIAIKRLEERLGQKNHELERPAEATNDDPLGDFIHAESEVRRARSAAARVIDAIRSAAAAAGRDLTPQEQEIVEMYEAAAGAAEEHIRRGNAADF